MDNIILEQFLADAKARLDKEPRYWTVERNGSYDPPWVLRYDPIPGGEKREGYTVFSLSFPVLQATDWVENPEDFLSKVADELEIAMMLRRAIAGNGND